jgi:hypothetical protein
VPEYTLNVDGTAHAVRAEADTLLPWMLRVALFLNDHISFDSQLGGVPVLTMHLIGDGNVVVENERAYKDAVRAAGDGRLLRQVYVERAGHCSFTAAETIVAFQALVRRIDTGKWGKLGPRALNGEAEALGLGPSAFARFGPKAFLRPFPD